MPENEIERTLIHWKQITQSWLHSRKALILLVTFVIANVALFVGKLNGDQYCAFLKWIIASYLAANVGDACAAALAGKDDNS